MDTSFKLVVAQKEKSSVTNLYKKIQITLSIQIFEVIRQIINKNYILSLDKSINKKINKARIKGNYWRKRNIDDGKIDFKMTSSAILQLVNSLSKPYNGAHIEFGNKKYKVWKVSVDKKFKKKNIEPGKIIYKNRKLLKVKTFDSAINLIDHEVLVKKGEKYLK